MAGELVPLVMLPRYSVFAGQTDFTTIAMDTTEYQNAILNVWRAAMLPSGGGATFALRFEESTDQVAWADCAVTASSGTGPPWDPTALAEVQYTATLSKRWFRLKLSLGGSADATVTCWAVGFLEMRER